MAHQWWGGRVFGANVQGNTLLSESLAHYSALRVTEEKYGKIHSRKILQFELDRYLRERTEESVAEMPWMKVENQGYIHYRKGVVVMNSIRERLGDLRLNSVLREYVADFSYEESPYPTTLDLKSRLDESATPEEREFIASLFEQITLYDVKMTSVESTRTQAGMFDITLTIDAGRFKADGNGEESELPLEEYIDIGLALVHPNEIAVEEDIFHLDRYLIRAGENKVSFRVASEPRFAMLDPFIKLVDRDVEDNYLEF
jgi:ABC-2 type transport system permease protein